MRANHGVVILAGALLASVSTMNPMAAVLIDNTADGTGTLDTGTALNLSSEWRAFVFQVASAEDLFVSSIKLGLRTGTSGDRNFTIALYNVDGSGVPTTQVGSYSWDFTEYLYVSTAVSHYHDFDGVSDPFTGFTVTSGMSYALVFKSGENGGITVNWRGLLPDVAPANTSYLNAVGYRFTDDSGTTWNTWASHTFNAIQIQGTSVPEPSEFVTVLGMGLIGFAAYRQIRNRHTSIQAR